MSIDLMPGFGAFTHATGLDGSEADGTNILLNTNNMATWLSAGDLTLAVDNALAPDGTTTALRLQEAGGTGRKLTYEQAGFNAATVATFSVYAKQGTQRYIQMLPTVGASKIHLYVDLQTGTITDSAVLFGSATIVSSSIAAAVNGFWKVSLRVDWTVAVTNGYFQVSLSDRATHTGLFESDSPDYSGAGGLNVYLWRAKLVV